MLLLPVKPPVSSSNITKPTGQVRMNISYVLYCDCVGQCLLSEVYLTVTGHAVQYCSGIFPVYL